MTDKQNPEEQSNDVHHEGGYRNELRALIKLGERYVDTKRKDVRVTQLKWIVSAVAIVAFAFSQAAWNIYQQHKDLAKTH